MWDKGIQCIIRGISLSMWPWSKWLWVEEEKRMRTKQSRKLEGMYWTDHLHGYLVHPEWWQHSVQSFSRVWFFATPWTAAYQASLSTSNSWSLLKRMSIESVMPSNHLILCRPLLLPPSIFPSIRVFSNESVLQIRWLKYWSFSFSLSPSNEYSGLISFRLDWFYILAV